jgi:hypothetical protein
VAVLVTAPWWGYCQVRFGSFVPQSGSAIRELASAYQGGTVNLLAWVWGTGFCLGPPLVYSQEFRHLMVLSWPLGLVAGVSFLGGYLAASSWLLRSAPAAVRGPAFLLAANGMVIFLFYVGVVPAVWFFNRYMAPTAVAVTILVAAVLGEALARRRAFTAAVIAVSVLLALARSASFVYSSPSIERDWAIDSPTGYRMPMVAALRQLPAGAVVGSLQSGALSYFASRDIRVVNLDGVVDRDSALAFRTGRLDLVLRERAVTYFVDWQLQHDVLRNRSSVPIGLDTFWHTEHVQKSGHVVKASRITWPAGS